MRIRARKARLVEWVLLAIVYPLQAVLAPRRIPSAQTTGHAKKIVLTLVPTHGNLGDHAIAHATRAYLRDRFPEYEVIEVDLREIYRRARALRRVLGREDLVMLLGGGNTGDLYRNEEWTRRFVLRAFAEHRVVSLPQTAHFTATGRGRRELRRTARALSRHRQLLFLCRDRPTFDLVRREAPAVRSFFQPDMVLYLDESGRAGAERDGVTVCLRRDRESALGDARREELLERIRAAHGRVRAFDTIAPHRVDRETRGAELSRVWDELGRARVAVTDRLHGMIFCFITRTPCVVVRSFDHKVVEAFRTLEGRQNFLFLVEEPTPSNVLAAIERAASVRDPQADDLRSAFFAELRERILAAFAAQDAGAPGVGGAARQAT